MLGKWDYLNNFLMEGSLDTVFALLVEGWHLILITILFHVLFPIDTFRYFMKYVDIPMDDNQLSMSRP